MLSEAVPSLHKCLTLTIVVVIGFSAMAGTLGRGLGDVAIRYGFQDLEVISCSIPWLS